MITHGTPVEDGINQPQEKSCTDICAKLLSWR
jgi:hypothetical protein